MYPIHFFDEETFKGFVESCGLFITNDDISLLLSDGYIVPTKQGYTSLHASLVRKWIEYAQSLGLPTGEKGGRVIGEGEIAYLKELNEKMNALFEHNLESQREKNDVIQELKTAFSLLSPFGPLTEVATALNETSLELFLGEGRLFLEQFHVFEALESYQPTQPASTQAPKADADDSVLELEEAFEEELELEEEAEEEPKEIATPLSSGPPVSGGRVPPSALDRLSLRAGLRRRGIAPPPKGEAHEPEGNQTDPEELNDLEESEKTPTAKQEVTPIRQSIKGTLRADAIRPKGAQKTLNPIPGKIFGVGKEITTPKEAIPPQEETETRETAREGIASRLGERRIGSSLLGLRRGMTENQADMATVVEDSDEVQVEKPLAGATSSKKPTPLFATPLATPRVNNSRISQLLGDRPNLSVDEPQGEAEEELQLEEEVFDTNDLDIPNTAQNDFSLNKETKGTKKVSQSPDVLRAAVATDAHLRERFSPSNRLQKLARRTGQLRALQTPEEEAEATAAAEAAAATPEAASTEKLRMRIANQPYSTLTEAHMGSPSDLSLQPPENNAFTREAIEYIGEKDEEIQSVAENEEVFPDMLNLNLLDPQSGGVSRIEEDQSSIDFMELNTDLDAPAQPQPGYPEARPSKLVDFSDLVDFDASSMGSSGANNRHASQLIRPSSVFHAGYGAEPAPELIQETNDLAQQIQQLNAQREQMVAEGNWAGVTKLVESRIDLFPQGDERQQTYLSLAAVYHQKLADQHNAMRSIMNAAAEPNTSDTLTPLILLQEIGVEPGNVQEYVTWLDDALQSPFYAPHYSLLRRHLSEAHAASGNLSAGFLCRIGLLIEHPELLEKDDVETLYRWAASTDNLREDLLTFFLEFDSTRVPEELQADYAYYAGVTLIDLDQYLHAVPFLLRPLQFARQKPERNIDREVLYGCVSALVQVYRYENNWQGIVNLVDNWIDDLPPSGRPELRAILDEAFARDTTAPDVIERYQNAYSQNPNNIFNVTRLAQLYANKGLPHDAVELLRSSYKGATTQQRPYILLQLAYIAEHNVNQGDAALDYYKQVNTTQPTVESHKGAARLCHARQEWDQVVNSINYLLEHREEIYFEERIAYINLGLDAANALGDNATYHKYVAAMNDV